MLAALIIMTALAQVEAAPPPVDPALEESEPAVDLFDLLLEPPIPAEEQIRLVESVEQTLRADAGLAAQHAGYRAFREANAEWDEAEAAYAELHRSSRLYEALKEYDEALVVDQRTQDAHLRHIALLTERPDLRDDILRLEGTGLAWTKQRLDQIDAATREVDGSIADRLNLNLVLDDADVESLELVRGDAEVRRRLQSWWNTLYDDQEGVVARAFQSLQDGLHETTGAAADWTARESLVVRDLHAAAWIRYWHRTVRRHPDLGPRYYEFLALTREFPELANPFPNDATENPWPPEGDPPSLDAVLAMPIEDERSSARDSRTTDSGIDRPTRPNKPERPSRIESGVRAPAGRPARPEPPEWIEKSRPRPPDKPLE